MHNVFRVLSSLACNPATRVFECAYVLYREKKKRRKFQCVYRITEANFETGFCFLFLYVFNFVAVCSKLNAWRLSTQTEPFRVAFLNLYARFEMDIPRIRQTIALHMHIAPGVPSFFAFSQFNKFSSQE